MVSDSLQPHESQHARPPCPSQTPRVYSNSCPPSQCCHPAIWSSVVPFSSCPQSLPASGSFPTSQLFAWGGQSIGVSDYYFPSNLSHFSSRFLTSCKFQNCDFPSFYFENWKTYREAEKILQWDSSILNLDSPIIGLAQKFVWEIYIDMIILSDIESLVKLIQFSHWYTLFCFLQSRIESRIRHCI